MLLFLFGFQCHYALNPPKEPPFGAKALVVLGNIKYLTGCRENLNYWRYNRIFTRSGYVFDSSSLCIQKDIFTKVGRNVIHGSDSVESANHEIGLWFTGADLCDYTQAADSWINEGN